MEPDHSDLHGKLRRGQYWSFGALTVLGLAALVALIWAVWRGPSFNTLTYEAAKTAMQVLAVTVAGGVVTIATFTFQNSRLQEAQREERNARRTVEAQDRRDRQDAALRVMLERSISTYNNVKRIRRLLKARASGGVISLDTYDKNLAELSVLQLEFEQLAKLALAIEDDRLRRGDVDGEGRSTYDLLRGCFRDIESYMNSGVIREYERTRAKFASVQQIDTRHLDRLVEFLWAKALVEDPEKGAMRKKRVFAVRVAEPISEIITRLQAVLLQPLVLPKPSDAPAVSERSGAKPR